MKTYVQLQYYYRGHDFIVASGGVDEWYLWYLYSENWYPNGNPAPEGGWVCCPDDYYEAFNYGKHLLEEICIARLDDIVNFRPSYKSFKVA